MSELIENITPGEGWRALNEGELTEIGDEYWSEHDDCWRPISGSGWLAFAGYAHTIRRKTDSNYHAIAQKLEVTEKQLNAIYPLATNLTKREYFAGLALQGLLADATESGSAESYAKSAVQFADALLAELEKGQQ